MTLTLGREGDLLNAYLSAKRFCLGPKCHDVDVGERGRPVEGQVVSEEVLVGTETL